MTEIHPHFKDNDVILAFSSSNYFLPYLTTTLSSLLNHVSDEVNYDILIFSKDATKENKAHVINFGSRENVAVRFIDVRKDFDNLNLYTAAHISIETYFRLLIPRYLKNFNRVLFLDSDIIVLEDVDQLYQMDMQGYPLAATEECLFSASLNIEGEPLKKYVKEQLELKNPETYFQAGVLLFDIKQFNELNYSEKLIEIASNFNYRQLDQDVLNKFFNENYCRFDNEWNWPPMQKHMKELQYIEMMSPYIREKYLAVSEPKIIHYADKHKPWFDCNEDKAVVWWQYARGTPFYELILQRMGESASSLLMQGLLNYERCKKDYSKYKLLAAISWGKRSLRHQKKRDDAQRELQRINLLFKEHNIII